MHDHDPDATVERNLDDRGRSSLVMASSARASRFGRGSELDQTNDDEVRSRRAILGYRIAMLSVLAALALALVAQTRFARGVPPSWRLLLAALAMGVLAVLSRRGSRRAPVLVPWFLAVAIPMLTVEPGLSTIPDFSFLVAPIAALVLSGKKTLWGTAALSVALLVARSPSIGQSPYLDASLVVVLTLMVAAMAVAQETMRGAFATVSRHRAIEGAAARVGTEVILWSVPRGEGDVIRYASRSLHDVLGYRFVDDGRGPLDHVHPEDRSLAQEAYSRARDSDDRQAQFECRVKHADGRWLWGAVRVFDLRDDPMVAGTVTSIRDVTDERFERETLAEALTHAAEHDWLTGLPNRRKLAIDIAQLDAGGAAPLDPSSWILFCDVDSFKDVNDSLGHTKGDIVLRSLVSRLRALAPDRALYRFGGDEFVIVARQFSDADVEKLASDLVVAASTPMIVDGRSILATVSVGVARVDAGQPAEGAIRDADIAMSAAKKSGKKRYRIFDDATGSAAQRRHAIGQALRGALDGDELFLVYQPKVDARSSECVGFEALLRWRSATLGFVSPADFIPIAEELGLISDIGDFVIERVCAQIGEWRALGLALPVSANVSVAQLSEEDRLVNQVRAGLARHRVPPELLELEITESALVHDADAVTAILQRVRDLGVALSVDDFGTGYSSLAYIRRFPVSSLKLDRSFVTDLGAQPESRAIVRAVLSLARDLHLETIAEGVETEDQRDRLRELGCDILQGYLFARPLSADDARAFAATHTARAEHVLPRRAQAMLRSLTPFPHLASVTSR